MRLHALLLCAAALPAFGQSSVPRYEVKRAPSAITVDGKLDDKAWDTANKIELIFPWAAQTGAKQKTTARVLWDDSNLYVSYDCDDADITVTHTQHDDPTYLDDAVEIFINPLPSQTSVYYGLEMNAGAVLYDYIMFQPGGHLFKPFDLRGVKLATARREGGWTLEVSIPWPNFEALSKPPKPGAIWTANINRWDGTEPHRRMSNWSDPQTPTANPHVPQRFGELIFVE
jgi:hypothetical protein